MLELYHAGLTACSKKSRIVLKEKGLDYVSHYVSLSDFEHHDSEYLKLNPNGLVPTLVHDGAVIIESTVINEYLDEVTEGNMLPADPLERAHCRAWIEFGNALLSDAFTVTSVEDEAELAKILAKLGDKLDRLEREIKGGPFFLGAEVSLVDAAMTPALQRLTWANEIHPPLALFAARPKVAGLWRALAERESVQGSAPKDLRQQFDKMVGRDRGGYRSIVGARVAA